MPREYELAAAIDFVAEQIDRSVEILSDSIIKTDPVKTTKEEKIRELTFLNFLMYGASTLLMRPTQKRFMTEHFDSYFEFGVKDETNKGLGFEIANFQDPNHEYTKLKQKHKDCILETRFLLIRFLITLAGTLIFFFCFFVFTSVPLIDKRNLYIYQEKLIEQNSTETMMFQYIARVKNFMFSIKNCLFS